MTEGQGGACDCGAIRYTCTGPVKRGGQLPLSGVPEKNGYGFSTYGVAAQEGLKILQGEEYLAPYEVQESGRKSFCSRCGTPLYTLNKCYPGVLKIFYGTLSEATGLNPGANIYCESKLAWVDAVSGIKSFMQEIERLKIRR